MFEESESCSSFSSQFDHPDALHPANLLVSFGFDEFPVLLFFLYLPAEHLV